MTDKRVKEAIADFFGEAVPKPMFKRIYRAIVENNVHGLSDDERTAVKHVKANLSSYPQNA